MKDLDDLVRECLRPVRGGATDEQFREARELIRAAMSDTFDAGFKAAGGTMIPDAAKRQEFVELSLDRQEIDDLADVAEMFRSGVLHRPGLKTFLEKISIYRRRR